ncbi:Hypothetical protein I595_1814 [Croceitalea dokdonensis DOKDO 023]|uniref:Uncharacterized protein n=1 Tax=Croceitalea dokdonensis DOKDO 023 TaxID=1300341 RepID=A0A0P7A644_9FLAO|nr:hypothetical protein [Croceitalea dokdonensis]KPM32165.1 Hypothetical protein I595_1814 [Croceitalea dokdonensis DOKDO 023]
MKKTGKRRSMLQCGILTLFTGMVLFSSISVVNENLWKGFTLNLGLGFFLFEISELVKHYKMGKVGDD